MICSMVRPLRRPSENRNNNGNKQRNGRVTDKFKEEAHGVSFGNVISQTAAIAIRMTGITGSENTVPEGGISSSQTDED